MTNHQIVGLVRYLAPIVIALAVAFKVILPLAACFRGMAGLLLIVFAITTVSKAVASLREH